MGDAPLHDHPDYMKDFAQIWRASDKIVYSKTLETVSCARTQIERDLDPDSVLKMKASAKRDITVGGPDLAAHAFRGGLVDECHLFLAPIVVGGGKQSLPEKVRVNLELIDERRFGNGIGLPPLRHRLETETCASPRLWRAIACSCASVSKDFIRSDVRRPGLRIETHD